MREIQCSNCAAFIGVPFLSSSAFVLLSVFVSPLSGVAALLAIQPTNLLLAFVIFVLGTVLSGACILWFYERLVPLVVKNA